MIPVSVRIRPKAQNIAFSGFPPKSIVSVSICKTVRIYYWEDVPVEIFQHSQISISKQIV